MIDQPRTFDPAAVPSAEFLFQQQEDVFAQKIRWTMRKLGEMKESGDRVLVVTRDDTAANSVQAACAAGGINSYKLIRTTTIHNQEQAVMAFRDPGSNMDALVVTFESYKGLRANHACRKAILVHYPLEFSKYAQVTSLLTYPNQVDKPVWDVALVNETLDVVEEAALARSGAASFIQNQQVHPFPHAQHKVIHAFYLAAVCMGKDHSHLPHCRTHWSYMESPEIEREGRFYFAIGQYIDHVPEDAHLINGDTIIQIAKSWVPGTPLTHRHVNRMLPPHANGVVLFNYVMGGYVPGML